jgi:geranylgeranyl diphosphate synthase type II
MIFLKGYSDSIEQNIEELNFPNQPENLYEPLRYFLRLGGKRIRPTLTLLAADAFGSNWEDAKNAALAVELFHNFTLIHDDIMDNAPLRRNKATVHERWNTNIAILAGDVLFVKAYEELGKSNSLFLKELFSVFSRTAREVCEGQQLDMDFENREDVKENEYIEMIRLKTSVLLGCALEMGAIIGGANAEDRANIYNFGVYLGIAFQIQDDILDLFGSPEKVGKKPGGDVICNKKTLLSILAKQNAKENDLRQLLTLETESNTDLKVSSTKELYVRLGAKKKCEEKMRMYYSKAMEALNLIKTLHSKQKLIDLSNYLFERDY